MFMMFVVGAMMLASSALLPPFLQNLSGYSVTDTGLLMAPRGVGTMIAMMFAGRFAMRVDPRLIMTIGMAMIEWSIWDMAYWTPAIGERWLIIVTMVQGFGMGFVFVPLQLVAFATLAPHFRTDGTALMNLVRNIGSAIGVSITTTVLAWSVQVNHSMLSHIATPFNRSLGVNGPSLMLSPQFPMGVANLDRLVEFRAQTAAFGNDFLFMFYLCLPSFLFIWLMRRPDFTGRQAAQIEVME
jgi:DHA2 family multidrug resistance protein